MRRTDSSPSACCIRSTSSERKAITQVVGYLMLENGIFIFGLLLIEAMPFLVEAGVLLDLFAGPPAKVAAGVSLPDHLSDVQIMLACWMAVLLIIGIHGVAAGWAERGEGAAAAEGPPSGAAVALLVLLVLLEVAALATFAVGVGREAPVWVLGASLAAGLLALAAIIIVYTRLFVRMETIRTERDDGIPW